MAFTSQPVRMNSVASQSSSSGLQRPLALRAEILHGLHHAGAEVHLPEAIHRHARRQRIGRIDQPFREAQPVVRCALRQRRQVRPERPARLCRRDDRRRRAAAGASRAARDSPASPSRSGSCRASRWRSLAQIQNLFAQRRAWLPARSDPRKHQRTLFDCAAVRFAASDPRKLAHRIRHGQHRSFLGSQRRAIDAHLVDASRGTDSPAQPAADAQRLLRLRKTDSGRPVVPSSLSGSPFR